MPICEQATYAKYRLIAIRKVYDAIVNHGIMHRIRMRIGCLGTAYRLASIGILTSREYLCFCPSCQKEREGERERERKREKEREKEREKGKKRHWTIYCSNAQDGRGSKDNCWMIFDQRSICHGLTRDARVALFLGGEWNSQYRSGGMEGDLNMNGLAQVTLLISHGIRARAPIIGS
jgi:hypothetical protein